MDTETKSERAAAWAKVLWDYLRLDQPLERADVIVVLGSDDLAVADRGAQLWLEGWAPEMVCTGGRGPLTRDWSRPEAIAFAERARRSGVPESRILLETESANTGDNIRRTRRLLRQRGRDPARWILVHKPYMERRTLATFERQMPGTPATVTSPVVTFETYRRSQRNADVLIHRLVGTLHRILIYPERGYLVAQAVPDAVQEAWERLIDLGYSRGLARADD